MVSNATGSLPANIIDRVKFALSEKLMEIWSENKQKDNVTVE